MNKVSAYRRLQADLMDASPYLVPVILPYKDLIGIVTEIEKDIKGSDQKVGRSNEELLADFLNGGDSIPILKETLDKGVKLEAGDGDQPANTQA